MAQGPQRVGILSANSNADDGGCYGRSVTSDKSRQGHTDSCKAGTDRKHKGFGLSNFHSSANVPHESLCRSRAGRGRTEVRSNSERRRVVPEPQLPEPLPSSAGMNSMPRLMNVLSIFQSVSAAPLISLASHADHVRTPTWPAVGRLRRRSVRGCFVRRKVSMGHASIDPVNLLPRFVTS